MACETGYGKHDGEGNEDSRDNRQCSVCRSIDVQATLVAELRLILDVWDGRPRLLSRTPLTPLFGAIVNGARAPRLLRDTVADTVTNGRRKEVHSSGDTQCLLELCEARTVD